MDYAQDIRLALGVLLDGDTHDHERLVAAMLRAGVANRALAVLLSQLIPLAWGRMLLPRVGVHVVSFEYLMQDRRSGRPTRHRFAEDPVYRQIQEELPEALERAGRRMKSVAARSPEVKVVQRQLAQGASPGDIMLGPAVLFG